MGGEGREEAGSHRPPRTWASISARPTWGRRISDRSTWGQSYAPAVGSKAPKILELRGNKRDGKNRPEVKLHKSENAYKIGAGKTDEESVLRRNVKSLLNKITAENFTYSLPESVD